MSFHVGQKVVCVNAGLGSFGKTTNLVEGHVYTVRRFWRCSTWDHPCVLLKEAKPLSGYAHDAYRFRPLIDSKSSISFTEGAPKDSEKYDNRRKVRVMS